MGQPSIDRPAQQVQQQIRMPVQNVAQHTEVVKETWQHNTMHFLEDNGIGFLILLGFAGIGVLAVFREKIKKWLR